MFDIRFRQVALVAVLIAAAPASRAHDVRLLSDAETFCAAGNLGADANGNDCSDWPAPSGAASRTVTAGVSRAVRINCATPARTRSAPATAAQRYRQPVEPSCSNGSTGVDATGNECNASATQSLRLPDPVCVAKRLGR